MTDIIRENLAACIYYYMAGLQTQQRWGLRTMKSLPGWLSSSKPGTGILNGGFSSEIPNTCQSSRLVHLST